MRVLIVDDEPLVRRSLARVASQRGHEVVEAENGQEGLRQWTQFKPELIFLDVLMPVMTGPQVLSQRPDKVAKVVLMSAYTGPAGGQSAQEFGADLFVAKPFEDVFAVVSQAEELLR